MNDERVLFDRAAQPMRPEFRAHLEDLFELLESDATPGPSISAPLPVAIELAPEPSRPQRDRRASWLLMAAAVVAILVAGAVLTRRGGSDGEVGISGVATEPRGSTPGSSADCAASTSLGQAAVGSGLVLVASLDDGRFCLDVGQGQLAIGTKADSALPADPTLVESGPVGEAGGYYYLFAVPQSVPVNVVVDEFGEPAEIFLNSVGRRLLIIEEDVDIDGPQTTRSWELRTGGGGVFATLEARGPLPRPATDDTTGSS